MKFECVFCCCSVIPSSIGEGLILFLIIWVTFSYTQQNMQNGRWRCSKKKNKHIILIMPTARSSKAMVIWILNSEHRVINMIRVEKIILICVCRRFLSIFTEGSNHEKKRNQAIWNANWNVVQARQIGISGWKNQMGYGCACNQRHL